MAARTPKARARHATRGLATRAPLDRTTNAMLLRQLYLGHFELKEFARALEVAETALALDVLPDVLNQDAARAAVALGDVDAATRYLRAAARRGPASRRPFHYWTLGSILFLAQRYEEASAALTRAIRWGTRDRPLYRAHLELVRIAAGIPPADTLQETIDQLSGAPCGQGYGRFVLGHLAYAAGEWHAARRYLEAFVRRTEGARAALAIALSGEVAMAKATLAKMKNN
jgi:tetratricopeptide (TPR) repeat protein